MVPAFDLQSLYSAVNVERTNQTLSWAALSRHVGVAASTIRRFEHADDAEADGVLELIRWLQSVPEDYIAASTVTGTRLSTSVGYVRVDMDLVAEASGDPGGAKGRTRTTIQHLARVALGSGCTVASLTRLSDV